MDFVWATLFFLWYEALSVPLRLALAGSPAPLDVRRLVSRLACGPVLLLPIWFAGHWAGWTLSQEFGWLWLGGGAVLGFWIGKKHFAGGGFRGGLAAALGYSDRKKSRWRREAAFDLLTFGLYLGLVSLRRWTPEMTTYVLDGSAAEKFMNAMIWWATWHAEKLPPQDYWFAGHPLTYYYWGHWHWTWVSRIGGFAPEMALTLALARMATFVFESSVLFARALGMRLAGASFAGFVAAWGGNPIAVEIAWQLVRTQGFPWRFYDFWKPSRALGEAVVDEFPAFSAVLGDFHAHHLSLGWSVAWMALLVAGWRWAGARKEIPAETEFVAAASAEKKERGRSKKSSRAAEQQGQAASPAKGSALTLALDERFIRLAVWGSLWLALGIAATLSNIWILPVLGGALATAFVSQVEFRKGAWIDRLPLQAALSFALLFIVLFGIKTMRGGEALPLAPESQAAGASLLDRLPVKALPVALRSTFYQLWSMWGFAILPLGAAALWRTAQQRAWRTFFVLAAMTILGIALVGAGWPAVAARIPGGTAWVWAGAGVWGISLAIGPRRWITRRAAWTLAASCLLLGFLELLFIDDNMTGIYERYNTYFKLCYPVWPPLMVATTQGALGLCRRARRAGFAPRAAGWAGRGAVALWFALLMVFPAWGFVARIARAEIGDNPPRKPTLDAFDFLDYRQELTASMIPYFIEEPMLRWIRANVPPGDVVAEAAWIKPGEQSVSAYDYNGRVASLAGHPVPLGWLNHEMQWRGLEGIPALTERVKEINRIYAAKTPEAMRAAAAAIGVKWALYGVLEQNRYAMQAGLDGSVLATLEQAGRLVAKFPPSDPAIFLFEFPPAAPKMKTP